MKHTMPFPGAGGSYRMVDGELVPEIVNDDPAATPSPPIEPAGEEQSIAASATPTTGEPLPPLESDPEPEPAARKRSIFKHRED